jgi:GNAT superfamily N-acetyltransferase
VVADVTRPVRRVEVDLLYRKELAGAQEVTRAEAPIDVAQATPGEANEIAGLISPGDARTRARYRARLEHGQRCLTARIDGQLVGFNWINLVSDVVGAERVELAEHEVFTHDAFTATAWRGRRIHAELLSRMLAFAQEAGRETAFTLVSATNRASRKTLHRLDWQISGVLLSMRLPGGRKRIYPLRGSRYPITSSVRRG